MDYHGRALEYRQMCQRAGAERGTYTMAAGMGSVMWFVVGKREGKGRVGLGLR